MKLSRAFARAPLLVQWLIIAVVSAVMTGVMMTIGMPAAGLLGPMLGAVAFCGLEHRARVPRWTFHTAQAVIGCLLAGSLTPEVLVSIPDFAPEIIAASAITMAASFITSWLLVKTGAVPAKAAVWGMMPGGASAMISIADESGADARLVAFMQYLRVVFVAASAALVAHYMTMTGPPSVLDLSAAANFSDLNRIELTLGVALLGLALSRLLYLPGGALLYPMLIGMAAQAAIGFRIELPAIVLICSYAVIGCSVGLRFEPVLLRAVLRMMPQVFLATLTLIAVCGVGAWGISEFYGLDLTTCFLAMSPGGIDTVAIIATGMQANLAFVLAVQSTRMFVTMLLMPPIARALLRRTGHD